MPYVSRAKGWCCLWTAWALMKKFEAANLMRLLTALDGLANIEKPKWENRLKLSEMQLKTLADHCEDYGLAVSSIRVTGLRRMIEHDLLKPIDFPEEIMQLIRTIQDELSTQFFLALEAKEAKAWNSKEYFGDVVSARFPETDFELEERSKCYSVGRYTAAVFHLMRVLEIGLTATAHEIGFNPGDKSWEQTLKGMQGRLEEIGKSKPENWKQIEQHYSELMAHFRNLKNAWRNYVMHVHEKYDKEREEEIFVHVRVVMKLLASGVKVK